MIRKNSLVKILVMMIALVMGIGIVSIMAMTRDNNSVTPPDTAKTLTPNGDGTYTLSLSVTGRAESSSESGKADVIVVLDRSGSMDDEETGYTEHSTGRYGLVDGDYDNLYRKNGGGYTQLGNDSYSGTVYYRTGSWLYDYHEYTGARYRRTTTTRLDVAKSAVNSLADQLLDNNTAANPDKVRLSLVTFANQASTDLGWTTNRNTFHNRVNNISANGGTNWEDALHDANAIQAREGADVYVIFVSDGNPTFRNTKGGGNNSGENAQHGTYPNYYYGSGNSDNNGKNFQYALAEAQKIVDADKNLYSVGAFGDATKMQNLATQSGAPASHYYDATDQAALNAAFANIINEITSALGYKNVKIEDGITGMTSALVKTDPNSFTYTRSGGAYGGGAAWNAAPAASYDGGKVTWDLGDAQLEDGVTYTLSFKVWPSQEAYDLVADLNNGIKTYDSLTPDQQEQIADIGGGYGLKTNTDVTFSYTQIETITTNQQPEGYVEGQPAADGYTYTYDPAAGIYTGTKETEGTCSPDNPDPMPLTNSKMYVEKQWDDSIDPTQRPNEVRLGIRRDDNSYKEVILNAANGWTQEIDVAPGLIANGETLETGHDYTIEEIDPDYHFELDADPFHPMIVDGVMKKSANASGAGQATAKATNVLRSRLQISKTVEHDTGLTPKPDQLFTYRIKVTDKKGDDVWFSIGNNSGPIDVSDQNRVTGATVNDADHRYYYAASGNEITVKIKGGENIYFTNLPKDSTYEVEEVDIPSGYSCTVTNSDSSAAVTGSKTSGTISEGNTLYSASYSNEYSVVQTTAKIPVNKDLSIPAGHVGPGDITGKYTFTLTADDNAPLPQVTSYTNPDADGGKVEFGDITYTKPGAYTYHVVETGSVDGVSNDPNASKTITVDVTDEGDGTLKAEVNGANPTAGDPANTTFTNSYATTEVSVRIPVTKALAVPQGLSGPGSIADKYTFKLEPQNGAPMPAAGGDTVANPAAAGGTASFGSITYDAAGIYTYKITETGTVDGVTNDPAAASGKTVTVRVSDDAHGHLSAVIEGADSTPAEPKSSTTFTNTYGAAPAKASIPVKKVLNAAPGLTPPDITNQYTFTLKEAEAAGSPAGTPMPSAGGETVTNPDADGGTVSFGEISYDRIGTYTYTVRESGTVAGIQNDTSTKTVTVTVTDNGKGKLSAAASVSANDPVTFTNTYSVNPVAAAVPVTKKLDVPQGLAGPTSIKEAYTFTLTPQGGAPAAGAATVKNPDSDGGTASFGAITFTKPGTYTYKITEAGTVAGVTNDPAAASGKTVTIEVRDNADGTLAAAVRGADATAGNPTKNTTFTNVYAVKSAKARIPVVKLLSYAPGLTPADITGKYEFTLTGGANAPMPSAGGETVTNPASTGGTANFGEIEYTLPGTYTYTITEDGNVSGITNDEDAATGKTVTVKVKDNKDGSLSAEVHGADETGQSISAYTTFTNTYKASGSVALEAAKRAEGFELKADQFSFELKDDHGKVLQTRKNNGDGRIVFDAITYSAPGSYHYTINEVVTKGDGITDDTHAAKVTVTVADKGDGSLTATPQYEDATFTNKHKDTGKDVASAADTTTSVDGELVQAGDELTYTITYANNTDSVATVTITDTIPANTTYVDGSASDGGVENNGVITWTIENVAAGATGTVSFKVKVSDDANGETIENTATVSDGENQSSSNAVTTSVPVKDVKDDEGTSVDGGSTQVGDTLTYEVTFKLAKDCTDVVVTDDVPANTTYVDGSASNGGVENNGTITWNLGALAAGTHTVRFQVTVDESAVTADAITNTASISVNNHAEVETNTTTTAAEKGGLTISKEVLVPKGFEIDANKTFTFTVSLTGKNGKALTGEYNYTGSSAGVIRDGGTIKLKHDESVTIAGLPAGAKYKVVETAETGYTAIQDTFGGSVPNGGDPAVAAFKNKYGDDVETTVSFPVKKVLTKATGLTGPDITEEFTFRLSTDTGNPVPDEKELKNPDADGGTVTFGPITYNTPGTYIYTIKESGQAAGVTNDTVTEKTVTVTVKDNGDGSLTATASSTADKPLTFTNRYGVKPVKAAITAKKLLENADLAAGAFNFELSAATGGAPMPASANATNAADGTITFGDITYNVPGTYAYKIRETAGSATYFDYDSAEKEVTVKVADNQDGTLTATVTGGGADAAFTNTYKAGSDDVFISAVKNVNGEAASKDIFEFTIEADDGGNLPDDTTVCNNGGSVTFGPIRYDASIFDGAAPDAEAETPAPEMVRLTFTPDTSEDASMSAYYTAGGSAQGKEVKLEKAADGSWNPHTWELPYKDKDGNVISYGVSYSTDGQHYQSAGKAMFSTEVITPAGGNGNNTAQADRTKVFHYTIKEKAGNAAGYTYDGHEEKVTVTVTDKGSGKLDVTVGYDKDGAVFNNTYKASGEVTITADKVLKGAKLEKNQFEFGLFEGDKKIGGGARNDQDGKITFKVPYSVNADKSDVGTHNYTIRELVAVPQTGYSYDSTVKNVAVKVTDNGNGTLGAKVIKGDDQTFTNAYKPLPTDVTLKAKKVLEGKKLTAGEFKFKITDKNGRTVSSGTNAADGTITFSAIPITKAGTYEFTVTEINDGKKGIKYDDSRHTYKVVAEEYSGALTVKEIKTLGIGSDDVVFKNVYDQNASPGGMKTGDNRPVGILTILAVLSLAGIITLIGLRKRSV